MLITRALASSAAVLLVCLITWYSVDEVQHVESTTRERPVAKLSDRLGVKYEKNAKGYWLWREDIVRNDVLVVIGGKKEDAGDKLVDLGYKVWRYSGDCLANAKHKNCLENYGYLQYLSDSDSTRPTAEHVVFLHGHMNTTWHQRESLVDLIERAVACCKKSGRYTTLDTNVMYNHWAMETPNVIKLWNENFRNYLPINESMLLYHCCAQFVIPKSFITDPVRLPLYNAMHTFMMTDSRSRGHFFEYVYHVIFGEPPIFRVHDEYCLAEGKSAYSKDMLDASIPLEHLSSNRMGAWTDLPGARKDTMIVVGRTNASGVIKDLAAHGYDVWAPKFGPCRFNGAACEHELRGYLTYLADLTRPQRDVIVFVNGFEGGDQNIHSRIEAAVEEAAANNTFVALHGSGGIAYKRYTPLALLEKQWMQKFSKTRCKAPTIMWKRTNYVDYATQFAVPYASFNTSAHYICHVDAWFQNDVAGDVVSFRYFWKFLLTHVPVQLRGLRHNRSPRKR
eukprot:TRINITY_DN9685_c0_g2_i1.p1 TRINITY_DN9685_c0_g2~~TRINITY_DN9685_c0_g2_i1.p1  ORF type:complete len:507 (+),score=72.82 TRINITY_DN9685_c0_g2_i1:61-1581(+)